MLKVVLTQNSSKLLGSAFLNSTQLAVNNDCPPMKVIINNQRWFLFGKKIGNCHFFFFCDDGKTDFFVASIYFFIDYETAENLISEKINLSVRPSVHPPLSVSLFIRPWL